MRLEFIIIYALLLLIIMGVILWPKPQPSETIIQARDSIQRITERNQILAMNARTLETRLAQATVKSKSDSARFYREITVKNQQLARKRVKIDTLILENPNLASYMETADSVFSMMRTRIDTLEAEKKFQASLYTDLIYLGNKQVTNLNVIISQKDLIIKDLEKQARKTRRGSKFLKIALPVVGVGALLFGAQL